MKEPAVNLDLARRLLEAEGSAIAQLAGRIDEAFTRAAQAVFGCRGKVVLTGVGKAGIIAQKISATLASTGTQSIFLHPVEALHGDIGRVQRGDVVIALSHSGTTEEILRLLDHLKARGSTLIALTGTAEAPLARYADVTISYGRVEEACPLGLAPTVSTSCMLALGDALAVTVMQMRDFQPEDFAAFHPAGALGRKFLRVEQAMTFRQGEELKVVGDHLSLGDALEEAERVARRSGAMLLVDGDGRLSGILTDGDLRRILVKHRTQQVLDRPVKQFMKADPKHVHLGDLASEALAVLNQYRIDELPVLDAEARPVGLIDVQDLLGMKALNNNEQ